MAYTSRQRYIDEGGYENLHRGDVVDETDPATGRTILKIRYSPASAEILYNIWCGRDHGTHFTATSGLANLYWSDSVQRAGETKKADLYLVRNYSYVNGAYIYVDDYTPGYLPTHG